MRMKNAAADDGGESEERKRAKRGAALGTTHERAALRTEAGYLLALLLSWRETRNAYTLRLNDADGVEMSVILRAACAMLSAPKDPSDPNDILGSMYAAGLPADPGEFIAGINQNVAAAVGMAPEPDGVMADLMRRLDYEGSSGGGAAMRRPGGRRVPPRAPRCYCCTRSCGTARCCVSPRRG